MTQPKDSIEQYTQGRMSRTAIPERQQGSGNGYTGALTAPHAFHTREGDTGVYDDTFQMTKRMSMPNYPNVPSGPHLNGNIGEFHPDTSAKI